MKRIKDAVWLVFTGFLIGLAMVIPGVSGGTMAMIIGTYERLIDTLSNIRKHVGESLWVILWVAVGGAAAFLGLSHVITYCLTHFLFPTIMLFVGAIVGGLPMLGRKVKGHSIKASYVIAFVVAFAMVISMLFLGTGKAIDLSSVSFVKAIILVVGGIVAAAAMVVPGISGSALLMTFGMYEPIMNQVSNLTTPGSDKLLALEVVGLVGIGCIIGIFGVAKVIDILLHKFEIPTYWAIIGFVIASGVVIVLQNFIMGDDPLAGTSVVQYIVGVVLALLGFFGTYKIAEKE